MKKNNNFPKNLGTVDVQVFGEMKKVSNTISQARLKVFYIGTTGDNRHFSKEFGEKIAETIPYAPVKGIYNLEKKDFEGHDDGSYLYEEKIVGIVPEQPNIAWEKHFDNDGIEREYLVTDIYLFTALVPEAKEVIGKSQSLEILPDTLEYELRTDVNGNTIINFLSGEFLGLQVLGDDVTPAFNGSSFFSLYKDSLELADYIKKFIKKQEGEQVDRFEFLENFRLSDCEKRKKFMEILNKDVEDNFVDFWLEVVYDDYLVCFDIRNDKFMRVPYTIENDEITLGEMTEVKFMDVTKEEEIALEELKGLKLGFEELKEKFEVAAAEKETLVNEKTELESKFEELTADHLVVTEVLETAKKSAEEFEIKISELQDEKVKADTTISDLKSEKDILVDFKLKVEKDQKTAILKSFETGLTEEDYKSFEEKMTDYTVADFKKELCLAVFENNPNMLNKDQSSQLLYTGRQGKTITSGASALVEKHIN